MLYLDDVEQVGEIIYDDVGPCGFEFLYRTVAVTHAHGAASCIAPHEDVVGGIAHNDSFLGSEPSMLEGLDHRLRMWLGMGDVVATEHE